MVAAVVAAEAAVDAVEVASAACAVVLAEAAEVSLGEVGSPAATVRAEMRGSEQAEHFLAVLQAACSPAVRLLAREAAVQNSAAAA
mmetsp:Transcript_25333/g.45856  ORF Transcript_25333/g.45856 Transcript_25333/m.45856 type:complete len:86 (-) Transcript_25333:1427-1684(-)